jgi:hypothetical protein
MDPRIRKHQLCNEEASITSSKRVPSFQPKQQVEGEWDADSWHQGEVTELFQKTGQANIYDVNFKDGDSGTFLSQDLRALPVSAQDPILSSAALDSHSYILEDTIVSKRYAKNFRNAINDLRALPVSAQDPNLSPANVSKRSAKNFRNEIDYCEKECQSRNSDYFFLEYTLN